MDGMIDGKHANTGLGVTALTVVVGGFIALASSMLLTLVAHLLVCLGMHPESVSATESAAPLVGLALGAVWAGRHTGRWTAGFGVGVLAVVFWAVEWCYLMGRWNPESWLHEALPGITARHLTAWACALAAASLSGLVGARLRNRGARAWIFVAVLVALLPISMLAESISLWHTPDWTEQSIAPGVSVKYTQGPDGSTVRLLTFDFRANPRLAIRLYDADFDDSSPMDDQNTTWLARNMDFVLDRLRAGGSRVLCIFNAGFFNLGLGHRLKGSHVAPVTADGQVLYNVRPFNPEDWTFGVTRKDGKTQFHVDRGVPWKNLSGRYDTAVYYIRPLIVNGDISALGQGSGVTRLRCSRTSIGWSADSSRLYVLIVRDPDGEMAGVRQWESGRPQTGGWDLAQLQAFWMNMGVPYAIVLDGGDSTQMSYLMESGRSAQVRSGYHVSSTLGYLHFRPLRLFVPAFPASQCHGGVMNYLYIEERG